MRKKILGLKYNVEKIKQNQVAIAKDQTKEINALISLFESKNAEQLKNVIKKNKQKARKKIEGNFRLLFNMISSTINDAYLTDIEKIKDKLNNIEEPLQKVKRKIMT